LEQGSAGARAAETDIPPVNQNAIYALSDQPVRQQRTADSATDHERIAMEVAVEAWKNLLQSVADGPEGEIGFKIHLCLRMRLAVLFQRRFQNFDPFVRSASGQNLKLLTPLFVVGHEKFL
jgi:hypothetical protein